MSAHTFSVCTPTPFIQKCINIDANKSKYSSYNLNFPTVVSYSYIPSYGTHTGSICTPTPFIQGCANIDSNMNGYFSANVGLSCASYSFAPFFATNPCKTIKHNDQIITTCPGTKTTVHLPQSQSMPSLDNIRQKLSHLENIIKGIMIDTNECIGRIDKISGVSAGGPGHHLKNTPGVWESVARHAISGIANPGAGNPGTGNNPINQSDPSLLTGTIDQEKEIKCKSCGCVWSKSHLLKNELWWCQMCSCHHVFSPFNITDFAPFADIDSLTRFHDTMVMTQHKMYTGHPGFWIN